MATTERRDDNCDLGTLFAHEAHSLQPSMANGHEMGGTILSKTWKEKEGTIGG